MILTEYVGLTLVNLTVHTDFRSIQLALVVGIVGMAPVQRAGSIELQEVGEVDIYGERTIQLTTLAPNIIVAV